MFLCFFCSKLLEKIGKAPSNNQQQMLRRVKSSLAWTNYLSQAAFQLKELPGSLDCIDQSLHRFCSTTLQLLIVVQSALLFQDCNHLPKVSLNAIIDKCID